MKMQKWEYRIEKIDDAGKYEISPAYGFRYSGGGIDREGTPGKWGDINDLGAQGWELVSVGWWEGSEAKAVFKRIIQEIDPEVENADKEVVKWETEQETEDCPEYERAKAEALRAGVSLDEWNNNRLSGGEMIPDDDFPF